jgi:hypothetical protein
MFERTQGRREVEWRRKEERGKRKERERERKREKREGDKAICPSFLLCTPVGALVTRLSRSSLMITPLH